MLDKIELQVNQRRFSAWKTARITRGIESISGHFELSISDNRHLRLPSTPFEIYEGDACSVLVNNQTVITGFVDEREISISEREHRFVVSGRDAAGDLVDCSVNVGHSQFIGQPADQVIRQLAAAYNIRVTSANALPPDPYISFSPQAKVFQVIDDLCRFAGVLPVSDGEGGIQLINAGAEPPCSTSLTEGANIISAKARFSAAGRFRTYVMYYDSRETPTWNLGAVALPQATDLGARAPRTLALIADKLTTPASAQTRVDWEAAGRAARADTVEVVVQGWRQANRQLWPINSLVRLKSPTLGLDASLLITRAVYAVSDSEGVRTELMLRRPDAFLPQPILQQSALLPLAKGVAP